jgi:hypothetical protein
MIQPSLLQPSTDRVPEVHDLVPRCTIGPYGLPNPPTLNANLADQRRLIDLPDGPSNKLANQMYWIVKWIAISGCPQIGKFASGLSVLKS